MILGGGQHTLIEVYYHDDHGENLFNAIGQREPF